MQKVVVVTGGNRGLGLEIAKDVRRRGHEAVIVARSEERAREAVRAVGREGGAKVARAVVGHLGSVAGAFATAEALLAACPRIDVLVHNAGLWPSRKAVDEQGLEEAFVVNHLAPFVLNHLLLPRLAASRGRIVLVTAGLYVAGRPNVALTPSGGDFHPFRTYPTTKACALALLPRFAALCAARGVTIAAVHPGVFRTGLGDRGGVVGALLSIVKRLWKPPSVGARNVTRLAFDPELAETNGELYLEQRVAPLGEPANDAALAEALYAHAVRVTGLGA